MIKAITTSSVWNGGPLTHDMFDEMQKAMKNTADLIAENARPRVRFGPGDPKHLRDTIRARSGRKGKLQATVHAAVSGEYERALPVAYVFAGDRRAGVYWAHMVEYGTYDKEAHPFLRPAMYANFNKLTAECERAGQRAVNRKRRSRDAARRERQRA